LPSYSFETQWTKLSGPGDVTFQLPDREITTAYFTEPGTYELRLTVDDTELTGHDDMIVIVDPENTAPVANAGLDLSTSLPSAGGAAVVALSGEVSDDGFPSTGTLTSTWSAVAGAPGVSFGDASAPATSASFVTAGTYVLRLVASDGELSTAADVTVLVHPVNQVPLVDAGADQSITLPPQETAVLDATVSDDGQPAGAAVTLSWTLLSGPGNVTFANAAAPLSSVSFEAPGTYTFRLTADDTALQASDDVVVTVQAGNTPPIVDAGPDQTLSLPVLSTTLVGSAVDDGLPGPELTTTWLVLSGPGSTEDVSFADALSPMTDVSFAIPGEYVLALVADDGVFQANDSVTIVIEGDPAVGDPPTAELITPVEGASITDFTDVVGSVMSESLASWTLDTRLHSEGAWTVLATGTTPVSGVLGVFDPSLLLNGMYQLRLRATDTAARVAIDTATVVVRDNLKVGYFSLNTV
jgi:hypothetical protein